MRKKLLRSIFAAVLTLSMLTGCSSEQADQMSVNSSAATAPTTQSQTTEADLSETSASKDTLIVGLSSDITSLDPAYAYDHTTNQVVNQITEGLLTFDESGVIQPKLCESWEVVDPTTYKYEIRDDVNFSDGSPMTMDDVMFSITRHQDPDVASYVGWFYDNVDSIEQTGDWEITVKLKAPDASWQYAFATTAGHIISKSYYEEHKDTFGTPEGGILGTGAYKFTSWTTGNEIVLDCNENYWTGEEPDIKHIDFQIIEEETTRVTAMVNGQIDFTLDPPTELLSQLEEAPNVNLNEVPAWSVLYLAMNCQKAPFDDVNVRKAISYAIDKEALYQSLLTKEGTEANNSMPFSSALYGGAADSWGTYEQTAVEQSGDIEKAKECLAASGYPDGFDCTLYVNTNSLRNSIALYVQQVLKEIGINVSIETRSGDEMITIQFGSGQRDYDMAIVKWEADYPDPSGNMYPLFYSKNAQEGGANTCNYKNDQYDALIDQELASTDLEERTKLMQQGCDILAEDNPAVIFYYPVKRIAMNSSITGFEVNASMIWNFYIKDMKLQ